MFNKYVDSLVIDKNGRILDDTLIEYQNTQEE